MAGSGVGRLFSSALSFELTSHSHQVVFYLSSSFVYLLLAAVLGIVSPSGNEGELGERR